MISSKLSVQMEQRRWTLNALDFFLDTVRTNAKTVLREASNISPSIFNFTWNVGRQLVTPLIEGRFNNQVGLGTRLFEKMAEILNKDAVFRQESPALPDQVKRCVMCVEEITGHEN